jgi:hypothetical protein
MLGKKDTRHLDHACIRLAMQYGPFTVWQRYMAQSGTEESLFAQTD